jgi:hypothetical protein
MFAATETYLLMGVVAKLIKYAKIYGRKTRNQQMKMNSVKLKGIEGNDILWETHSYA